VLGSTDVFVVGGGPAGLAAAIAARQQGLRVVLADGAKPPIDKPCGEGLLPDAVAALAQLGVRVPAADAFAFRGIRFRSADLSAEGPFPSAECGISVRRTVLHRIMSERAAELGVDFLWQTAVMGISGEQVHLADHAFPNRTIHARWIVGADGSGSRVRRWAGLDRQTRTDFRYAFRRHYRVAPWTNHMEVYWGQRSQGYTTGVGKDQVCVALASRDPKLRMEEALLAFPELNARLRGAQTVSSERGALTANRTLKRVCHGNVALVGDASGTVDAIAGEGLGLSFHQAMTLAESLKSGDLSRYQVEHRRLAQRPLLMARLMLMLDGRSWLQRRTLKVFRKQPQIFRELIAFHIGAISPSQLAFDSLNLGWELLTA
jgi:flavin-dependent dehydrogenase